MPYKILSFAKDHVEEDGKLSIIAQVQQEGNEANPFKVLVEHVTSVEQAQKDVQAWIDARVEEDKARETEKINEAETTKNDQLLADLNASLETTTSEEKPAEVPSV